MTVCYQPWSCWLHGVERRWLTNFVVHHCPAITLGDHTWRSLSTITDDHTPAIIPGDHSWRSLLTITSTAFDLLSLFSIVHLFFPCIVSESLSERLFHQPSLRVFNKKRSCIFLNLLPLSHVVFQFIDCPNFEWLHLNLRLMQLGGPERKIVWKCHIEERGKVWINPGAIQMNFIIRILLPLATSIDQVIS